MGNRAVITTMPEGELTQEAINNQLGVYLHWNGGKDSIEPILKYCKLSGFRAPEDDSYGWARLVQVIANMFPGSNSLGVGLCSSLDCDNYDNGVYLIKDWEIVGRLHYQGAEQDSYDPIEFMLDLNQSQPEEQRIKEEKIREEL